MMHFSAPQEQIIGHHAMMKHKIPEFLLQAMPPSLNPHGNPQLAAAAAHAQAHAAAAAVHANSMMPTNEECGIRDVWRHNLEEEFHHIRQIVQKYPFVAMDTEFPGVVARPIGEFRSTADYHYHMLRCNVDLLRIIQLGLTFMDEEGKRPNGFSTWQFNFKFNLSEDMYAQDSIDLLQNSGIQFKKHEEDGIDPADFAEMLMVSGIVLDDNIKWLCFHSGYDFGYLLKLLTDQNLPAEESEFFDLLRDYFPNIYDIKYLMKSCKNLKGGLQEVADQLEIRRLGPQHQAGSDALLTGMAFFKMREVYPHINDFCMCWNSAYALCRFNRPTWIQFQYAQFATLSGRWRSRSSELLILPRTSICHHSKYYSPIPYTNLPEFVFSFGSPYLPSYHWPFIPPPIISNLRPNAMVFMPSKRTNNANLSEAQENEFESVEGALIAAGEVIENEQPIDSFAGGDFNSNESCVRLIYINQRSASSRLPKVFLTAPYKRKPAAKSVYTKLMKKDQKKLKKILTAKSRS